MLYVAVITDNYEAEGCKVCRSLRADGSWSCFIGPDREAVIEFAIEAKKKYEQNVGYGPYTITVGTLTHRAIFPLEYKLVNMTNKETL